MKLGEKIRALRRGKNMSQEKLAKQIKVHPVLISRYERGESSPSVNSVRRLAKVFRVSTDELLLDGKDETAKSRIPDKDLFRQFEEVGKLGEEDKHTVKTFLDAFLAKRQIQNIVK